MTTTATQSLFAPVQEGLAAVELRLGEVVDGQHPSLTTATQQILQAGGKRVRPAIALLVAGHFGANHDRSVALAAAVEMLHTATLVHDDLIDGALLRRGQETLNVAWSPGDVVLTGDYLFARSAAMVARTKHVTVMERFAETLMAIVNGEITQRFSNGRISRQAYYDRIYAKTAALFVLAAGSAALLAEASEADQNAVMAFGREVGMAFQMVDDVLDFVGTPDQLGKPAGSDLRQGLITLPSIYYLESHADDPDMAALAGGKGVGRAAIPRLVAAVQASGATDATLREAADRAARGRVALDPLSDSPYKDALVTLSQRVVDRKA
jgi:geranylgeranyl pyrophosphate synthase